MNNSTRETFMRATDALGDDRNGYGTKRFATALRTACGLWRTPLFAGLCEIGKDSAISQVRSYISSLIEMDSNEAPNEG